LVFKIEKLKIILKIIILVIAIASSNAQAQVWLSKNAKIRFFSKTPLEDIEAASNYAAGALNTKTGRIFFKVMMKSFKFENALMEEHFNENYIESDKYPSAEFDGIIQNIPDFTKDGNYELMIKGSLLLHATKVPRDIKATFRVTNGKIEAKSIFLVPCQDHNIKIPSITRKNISDNIEVTILANFTAKS
jgi:hypothetical protein